MFRHQGEVVFVHQRGAEGGQNHAHGYGDEHQARGRRAVAFAFLVDDRIGDEEHVQQAVQDGHVEGDEEDDGLLEEQLEGPDQEDSEAFAEGAQVEVLFGHELVVAGVFAHLLRAAA